MNEADDPIPLTSELIWISDLRTGDYHDNMNVNMFMKWITTKVIPLTDRNYLGVQMVPVMDNAPYHNARSITSLASFSKKIAVNLMNEHRIYYVILLMTGDIISLLPEQYNFTINNGHLQIIFNKEKLQKRKTKSNAL